MPTERELLTRNPNLFTDVIGEYSCEREVESSDVGDVADSAMERKRGSTSTSVTPVDESHRTVAPSMLLSFASNVPAEHASTSALGSFTASKLSCMVSEPLRLLGLEILTNQSRPPLLVQPQITAHIYVELHGLTGKEIVVADGIRRTDDTQSTIVQRPSPHPPDAIAPQV